MRKTPLLRRRQEETDCDYTWLCLIITTIWPRHPLPLHVIVMYTPHYFTPQPRNSSIFLFWSLWQLVHRLPFSSKILSSSQWLQHLKRCPFQYLSSRNRCSMLTEMVFSLCITLMQWFQNMPANSLTPLQSRGGVCVFSLWIELAWVTTY